MDNLFSPCRFTDTLHDMPGEAIHKLPLFVHGDSITAAKHILKFNRCITIFCSSAQYNHEDVKIRLFPFSLKGDAMDWFRNCPGDSFTSLQYIIDAFKDRYMKQGGSPCAPSTMQKSESDLVKN